jgi:lysophospholipase L1-like esterase
MNFFSKMKRPGATVAGIFSLALTSVVLLCGAGSAPIEKFSPQGAMQADLNAGGHNLTNVGTMTATNVVVNGSLSAANLGSAATNAASAFAPASGSANYQAPLTLTTTGTSGAATLSGTGTLNIPQYSGGASYSFAAPLTNGSGTVAVAINTSKEAQTYTVPANSVMLVFGDSISTGYTDSTTTCWEYYLSLAIPNLDIYSFGVVGSTAGPTSGTPGSGLAFMAAGSGSYMKWSNGTETASSGSFSTILSGYSGAKFGVAAYGANDDRGVNGMTAANWATSMTSIYASLHGLGLTVIGTSITPQGVALAQQATFNSFLREDGPPYVAAGSSTWDFFADVGGISGISNPYDTTLLGSDTVHPTPAGHQVYANQMYRAITTKNYLSTGLGIWAAPIMSDGNCYLPSSALVVNSPSTPSTSGQILTIGTRGGAGAPLTVDNGTSTICGIANSGYFFGNNGASFNSPTTSSSSTSVLIVGTRGGSANLLHCDNGSSATFNINSSGAISLCQGITNTGTLTTNGNVVCNTAPGTLLLKGGGNAASGTVTLSSGTGTITSSAITASSVILLSLKTSSGTPGAYLPLTTVSTGTCVVSGLSTDNSTYNWGEIIVNQ